MPGHNDEPPISDGLRQLLTQAGYVHATDTWVRAYAAQPAPIPANDDEALKGDAPAPPKTVASAAMQDPDDKRTQDAKYRAKERAEDARRGIAQCVLRLPRPVHPPLQAIAAEARESGGSRAVLALAALGLRPEWREVVYGVETQADPEMLIAALAQIVKGPALRRLVRTLATRMAETQPEEAGLLEDLVEVLLLQPTLRKLVTALIENPQLQNFCNDIASDERSGTLVARLLAHPDRRFVEAVMLLEQDDRATVQSVLTLEPGAKRALLIAVRLPQFVEVLMGAANDRAVLNELWIAVTNPTASSIGRAVLQSTGLLGWLVRKTLDRIVRKQTAPRARH